MESLVASVLLNGLAYSMLLFLMAAGLSLIFGFMNVLNFAHGSFFMIGAYVGLTAVRSTGSFWLAVLVSAIAVGIVGYLMEKILLTRIYHRRHMDQAILTMGLSYVFADVTQSIWGTALNSVAAPAPLNTAIDLLGRPFPMYRLGVIAFGLVVALALWLTIGHTGIGAVIRAGTTDREMVAGLGVNVGLVFTLLFTLGVALAGAGGVLGSPILGVKLGMDVDTFIRTLVVVVIGGLGSLPGAFWGAILVGMSETIGIALFPQFALVLSYAIMALVLLVQPAGLLGRKP